ncbi:very-short-patch-repair endonuclease [Sphingomonas zeicaulis]|uniref:endonuclease domain-containing protein n=1 Tax=Sphingomonas zeicaulis TaxID=1632740 RepID=UPI003D2555F7
MLPSSTTARGRALRRNATEAETLLWRALREKLPEAKFRRQQALGPYFADFCSHRAQLVVEVDGGQHAEAEAYDAARTAFIGGEGYRVIRFWNHEVLTNPDGVLARIAQALTPPHPPVR